MNNSESNFYSSSSNIQTLNYNTNNNNEDNEYFFDKLKNIFLNSYNSTTHLTVDESMIPSQSRYNVHHQYIANKPHRDGIKIFTLSDQQPVLLNLLLHRRINEDATFYCKDCGWLHKKCSGEDHAWFAYKYNK